MKKPAYMIEFVKLKMLIFLLILLNLKLSPAYKLLDILETEHLKYEKVRRVCSQMTSICRSNSSNVCAVRFIHKKMVYRDFTNSCFVYMRNMCDYPGQEYAIIVSGPCKDYLKTRRNSIIVPNKTQEFFTLNYTKSTQSTIKSMKHLRARPETTLSTLYDIETAYDFHVCPLSCPNTYDPVCVAVNRGHGLYFKFYTFVNHCAGDLYYCKHWEEFSPPPDEGELVKSSPLSWSYCAANKYIQYARFSEVTSSMGYYGWLAGDYKYSHIMEPNQQIPGYG